MSELTTQTRYAGQGGSSETQATPPPRKRFSGLNYGLAVAMVLGCTLVGTLFIHQLNPANLVMLYLLGMLPVALQGEAAPAVAAAILSVLAFDWFFIPPYGSLTVADSQSLFTLGVMGLVGVLISTLTARLKAESAEADQRSRRARALYALSRSLLEAGTPAELLAEGARIIGRELGLPIGAWLRSGEGEFRQVASAEPPLGASENEALAWVLREGRAAGPGTETLPGLGHLLLPVRDAGAVWGALALSPPVAFGLEAHATLETGANQIAISLAQAHARQEAAEARGRAESEKLRSALLASVSHDLRTPLTGIIGAAGTLAADAEALAPGVRRELAQGIVDEAERLARLVANLLQATRLGAGGPLLNCAWVSIEDVLAPTIERLSAVLACHPLEVELAADSPPLYADAILLDQVFANLLENAARHTPPGTPLSLKAWRVGDRLVLELADRGPGLPAGREASIFERFVSFPAGAAGGTGLGLAICHAALEAHGGSITAENRPGGGALFRLSLPLAGPVQVKP